MISIRLVKKLNVFIVILWITGLSGCATTDVMTHYGVFTAENSSGKLRQFRVYWQVLRYEGWSSNQYRAMPLVLETQCSQRNLLFYDESFGKSKHCSDADEAGIFYCADNAVDMTRNGLELDNGSICGIVTDRKGSTDLLSLEGEILLTLNCRPKKTQKRQQGKLINIDYLLNSEIPYVVKTKAVKGSEIDALIPPLSNHSSICDPDS